MFFGFFVTKKAAPLFLEEQETDLIENTLRLKDVKVSDVMTPRTVIFALNKDMTVGQVLDKHTSLDFTRIPIFDTNLDVIVGIVNRYDIVNRKADDQFSTRMSEISKEVPSVNENDPIDEVLRLFIQNRYHLALVLNNDNNLTGLITLEDAIETLLGIEITDESDVVADLRKIAEERFQNQQKLLESIAAVGLQPKTPLPEEEPVQEPESGD